MQKLLDNWYEILHKASAGINSIYKYPGVIYVYHCLDLFHPFNSSAYGAAIFMAVLL